MWSIWLRVFPTGEGQVYLWMFRWGNIVLLKTGFFDLVKFTILTSLSLLSWCRLSFQIVGFKILSFPNFAIKSPNRIFIWCWRKLKKPALILHKTVFWIITLLHTCFMGIEKNGITPATSQNYIWHPIANKLLSQLLTLLCCVQKILFPIDDVRFLFNNDDDDIINNNNNNNNNYNYYYY